MKINKPIGLTKMRKLLKLLIYSLLYLSTTIFVVYYIVSLQRESTTEIDILLMFIVVFLLIYFLFIALLIVEEINYMNSLDKIFYTNKTSGIKKDSILTRLLKEVKAFYTK